MRSSENFEHWVITVRYPAARHVHMVHHVSQKIIPVPAHGNKDVGMGLLRKIVRDAGVSVDEWQKI